MRHFTLVNNSGDSLDITTTEILFHDISGLGFDEDNDFRQIGDFWQLNRTSRQQATISGSVIFNEGKADPYTAYRTFVSFISKPPLTLLYNPMGPIRSSLINSEVLVDNCYRRTVRVAKLDKSEKNEYGVLDCSIEFACYTPWFSVLTETFIFEPKEQLYPGWFWAGTETKTVIDPETEEESTVEIVHPPLVFEPTQEQEETVTKSIFRDESPSYYDITNVDLQGSVDCPIRLIADGPLLNPIWSLSLLTVDSNGLTKETEIGAGSFIVPTPASNVVINEGEQLIVDALDGVYQIYRRNANGTTYDLYPRRNFGQKCFLSLKEGTNRIAVLSSTGDFAKRISIEGHIYHATV